MPNILLPATAAAYAPRAPPKIVFHQKRVEPWVTATLRRAIQTKRTLNNVTQHSRCLTELLSGPNANWTLCSLLLPKEPTAAATSKPSSPRLSSSSGAGGDSDEQEESVANYKALHIEAYVVHVDMVTARSVVAFKLTQDTIDTLIEYHKEVYSADVAATMWECVDKDIQIQKLREEFERDVNRFVFRTDGKVLEGMGEEGDGELLEGRAEDAKAAVNALFKQPSPPTPAPQFQQTFIAGLGITFPSDAATITGNMDFYGGSSSNFWSQPMVPQASTMTNASTFVPFPPFPASPPNSSTAHSPFSSPPNSYTTDFTFAGDFSSPSPPPSHSTRLPQPLYCASSPPTSFANKYSSHYNDSGNASDAFACSPPTGFGMGFSPQPLFPSMLAEQRRDSIMSVSGFSGGSGEQYVEPVIPGFSQHFSP